MAEQTPPAQLEEMDIVDEDEQQTEATDEEDELDKDYQQADATESGSDEEVELNEYDQLVNTTETDPDDAFEFDDAVARVEQAEVVPDGAPLPDNEPSPNDDPAEDTIGEGVKQAKQFDQSHERMHSALHRIIGKTDIVGYFEMWIAEAIDENRFTDEEHQALLAYLDKVKADAAKPGTDRSRADFTGDATVAALYEKFLEENEDDEVLTLEDL